MPNYSIYKNNYDIFEGMTSISSIISAILGGSSKRKIVKILYNTSKSKSKYNELKFLQIKSSELNFELEGVPHTVIDDLASGKTHGGIICICERLEISRLTSSDQINKNGFYVILDGIEDPFNFAYAIRSIYAAGADGVIVPSFRFNDSQGLICKGSAGTSELIDIFECDMNCAIDLFKNKGYKVASAGIRDSVSLYDADLKKPILLIIGGEKRGISADILAKSDMIVRVDYGKSFKGSLTASSAATVLSFEVFRQNR
jgi:23S rRNA (guanosine2251-2'-O)-methyltransferase